MQRLIFLASALMLLFPQMLPAGETEDAIDLVWLSDYGDARNLASESQKMLLVYFYNYPADHAQKHFESKTLNDETIKEKLSDYVLVKVPTTLSIKVDGKDVRLLSHAAFRWMNDRPGLAVIDLKNKDKPYHGHAVSCLPFETPAYYAGPYYGRRSVSVLLGLPPGTLTQRSMIYAVRVHPEFPASTNGHLHPVLCTACTQHSAHQASIRNQGHHNWESRFHSIWGRMRGGKAPKEVCAESWPGKTMLAACIDCVHSWHHSPGHWSAVRGSHNGYGYDIRQGSNGIWYATGIFGG